MKSRWGAEACSKPSLLVPRGSAKLLLMLPWWSVNSLSRSDDLWPRLQRVESSSRLRRSVFRQKSAHWRLRGCLIRSRLENLTESQKTVAISCVDYEISSFFNNNPPWKEKHSKWMKRRSLILISLLCIWLFFIFLTDLFFSSQIRFFVLPLITLSCSSFVVGPFSPSFLMSLIFLSEM